MMAGAASGQAAGTETKFIEREMVLDRRYLNLPVKADAPRRTVNIMVGGEIVRAFEIELAGDQPDFWAFTDVSEWRGQKATLRLDPIGRLAKPELQEDSAKRRPSPQALDALRLSDEIEDAATLYREPLRPQFHYTTPRGWLNDPHGLIFHEGEYHLFYQLQPFSMKSLNSDKHWGHAVSRDLVHWQELPVALRPGRDGGMWSGGSLIDKKNTAGFQQGPEPAMLLFYTATGRSAMNPKAAEPGDFVQGIAYSNDRGRSWTKYSGNPILQNITPLNRDPHVFWHEPSKKWIMVLYVGEPISNPGNHYKARILSSENLKDWVSESSIDGLFDCPVLFELPLDGKATDTRWIIHCANMKYRVGRFDGKTFTPETDFIDSHKANVSESAYAAQIFRNLDEPRTVQLAWLYDETPGTRQMMTFPCELTLVTTAAGPRLRWQPVREIERLYGPARSWRDLPITPDGQLVARAHGRHLEIKARIQVGKATEVQIAVRGIPIVLHPKSKQLTAFGYAVPLTLKDNLLRIRILVDETSLEIFADDGFVYLPLSVPLVPEDDTVSLSARGGQAMAETLDIVELKSIWPEPVNAPATAQR